jgi:hypothetical protein
MKRFIIKTLLLLLPIAILAISMEYLLKRIPNDYIFKKEYLDKHSNEIEILILGSSEALFGINPDYFTQNTFNACHVSQSLDLDFEIFKKYQNRFNNLNIIILPISYHTLWRKLKNSEESWRVKNYAIYYGIDTKSWTDHSELLNGKLGINIQRLYKYYFEKKDDISCSTLGWGTTYKAGIVNDLEETAKAAVLRHTCDINSEKNTKLFTENMQILNSFAEICNQKNVKVIFLTTPTYYTYREKLNSEQLNEITEAMNNFVTKHTNCRYINWSENPDFVTEDFYDADHLNETGAEKLSVKLAQEINSLISCP